jgi:hypothetical protein
MREYLWKFVCEGINFEWLVLKMLVYPQSLLRECIGGRIWVDHIARFGRGIELDGFEWLISFGLMYILVIFRVFCKDRCVLWWWSLLQQKWRRWIHVNFQFLYEIQSGFQKYLSITWIIRHLSRGFFSPSRSGRSQIHICRLSHGHSPQWRNGSKLWSQSSVFIRGRNRHRGMWLESSGWRSDGEM